MVRRRNLILILIGIGVLGFIAIQFIPVGNFIPALARSNPPIFREIKWDSPQTEEIVRNACYDCHSNETEWPFYAYIAPVSWLVAHDVNDGRSHMNFSEQSANDIDPEAMIDQIERGNMPLPQFQLLHPEARLTDEQKQILYAGLRASLHGTNGGSRAVQPPVATPEVGNEDSDFE